MNAAGWIEAGPRCSYHDSPSGEEIEVGYLWRIVKNGQERSLRIEIAPGAIHNDVVVTAILRNQLAEEDPPERILVLPGGELRVT